MMTDQAFESRLDGLLRDYAERGVRPFDRLVIARATVAAGTRGRPVMWRGRPVASSWRLALALVLALTVVVASAALIGDRLNQQQPSLPVATGEPTPLPTLVPPTVLQEYKGIFSATGGPAATLSGDPIVQLRDGRVLDIGGTETPLGVRPMLWDPISDEVVQVEPLTRSRRGAAAVVLNDGRVLIIGGDLGPFVGGGAAATYSTAELFDPETMISRPAGALQGRGWAPSAILLSDGRVLVTDGISVDDAQSDDPLLDTAEVYDPATDSFTATGTMVVKRGPHPGVLLRDGRVFITGGRFPETGIAETFDPRTMTFSSVGPLPAAQPHPAGGAYWPQVANHLAMLPDGRVLVAGRGCQEIFSRLPDGRSEGWHPTSASIFDPTTDTLTAVRPMPHCIEGAYSLPNGQVLLRSFWHEGENEVDWSGLYDPATDTIRETGTPPGGRYLDVLPLADGRVLFMGNGVEFFQ